MSLGIDQVPNNARPTPEGPPEGGPTREKGVCGTGSLKETVASMTRFRQRLELGFSKTSVQGKNQDVSF